MLWCAWCPDQEDGTLALLDFGQVQALSAKRQRALARLVIALDNGWPPGIVAAMKVSKASLVVRCVIQSGLVPARKLPVRTLHEQGGRPRSKGTLLGAGKQAQGVKSLAAVLYRGKRVTSLELYIQVACGHIGATCCAQGMGLEFLSKAGGVADPLLITIVASIIFDVRQASSPCSLYTTGVCCL